MNRIVYIMMYNYSWRITEQIINVIKDIVRFGIDKSLHKSQIQNNLTLTQNAFSKFLQEGGILVIIIDNWSYNALVFTTVIQNNIS